MGSIEWPENVGSKTESATTDKSLNLSFAANISRNPTPLTPALAWVSFGDEISLTRAGGAINLADHIQHI